jgi:8-oxo-dGTP pyrophosphatase MutT (NUDIX family)
MREAIEASGLSDDDFLMDQPAEVEIVDESIVFTGRVWNIRHETFRYNDETLGRDFVAHTGAVAVLVLDDEDRILAIRQYRHPVRLREWEIPAGLLDIEDEDPLAAAKRELAEEADLEADNWSVLADYATSPGGSNEIIRIFIARGLHVIDEAFARTGEEADIEVRWVSLDDAYEAALNRRITNSVILIAVMSAFGSRARGWSTLLPGDSPWPLRRWRDESAR